MRRSFVWLLVLLFLVACGGRDNPPGGSSDPGSISGLLIAPGTIGEPTRAEDQLEVIPGEVIVKFKADFTLQSFAVGAKQLQSVKKLATSEARLYRAGTLSQAETLKLVDDLEKRPDVEYAHPNWVLRAFKTPNDEFYGAQWHYEAMNLPAAWDIEDGSSNEITIAVVDSGIVDHPDLALQTATGYDFISDPTIADDGNGRDGNPQDEGGDSGYHGSHVAGTIGATTNDGAGVAGVNWNARIVPVRALGITGGGSFVDILEATAWAAGEAVAGVPTNANPAQVINMSLGADIEQACPSNEEAFFQSLASAGIIVVVAAGNSNVDMSTTFPANCDGVITVGATGPTGERAPYSNFGSGIDVMAPGGDITKVFEFNGRDFPAGVLSTVLNEQGNPDFAFYNGTSMASPHIAGLVSLMLARDPSLTFDNILTRLRGAATPLTSSQCRAGSAGNCGAGFVDAEAALLATSSGGTPQPTPPVSDSLVYAFAFYCTENDCLDSRGNLAVDTDKSVFVEVPQERSAQPYTVGGLEEGIYVVAAWQDIDGDVFVDDSDPFGVFPVPVPLDAGQDIDDIDIFLEAVTPTLRASPVSQDVGTQVIKGAARQLLSKQ
jgi:serine protease